MRPDFARPANKWYGVTVPRAAHLGRMDRQMVHAVDGDDGGSWTNTREITIGGAGITWTNNNSVLRGGIVTYRGGRLILGNNDFPTYNPARSRNISVQLWLQNQFLVGMAPAIVPPYGLVSGGVNAAGSPATIQTGIKPLALHHGAVLTNVTLCWRVTRARTALPTNQPRVVLLQIPTAGGPPVTVGSSIAAAGSPDAYYNGGKEQFLGIAALAHTIDTSAHWYVIYVADEDDGGGANTLPGNIFHSVNFNFTTIADAHFH